MTGDASGYVRVLRELGFVPIDPPEELQAVVAHDLKVSIPNAQERAEKSGLTYIAMSFGTMAFDETGQQWSAPGKVDLEPFGFKNNTERFRQILPKMAAEILKNRSTQ